jgi:hypothetical protein
LRQQRCHKKRRKFNQARGRANAAGTSVAKAQRGAPMHTATNDKIYIYVGAVIAAAVYRDIGANFGLIGLGL